MRYQAVRELLDQVHRFRQYAPVLCGSPGHPGAAGGGRLCSLLDYLSVHAYHLTDVLAAYGLRNAPDPHYSRIRYLPNPSLARVMRQMEKSISLSEDDLVRIGLLLDDHLQLALTALAGHAETSGMRLVLSRLRDSMHEDRQDFMNRATQMATPGSHSHIVGTG